MNVVKLFAKSIFSNKLLLKLSKGNRVVFLFHDISPASATHHSHHYSTSSELFEEQLNLITELFELVPLNRIVSEEELPKGKNYASITFDDGFYSVFEIARPLLKERKIPYSVFLNRAAIESNQMWVTNLQIQNNEDGYSDRLRVLAGIGKVKDLNNLNDPLLDLIGEGKFSDRFAENYKIPSSGEKIYMDENEIKILQSEGVLVGNHSKDHFVLSSCKDNMLREQITENALFLEELIKVKTTHFAIPFGKREHYNQQVIQEIQRAGHKFIYSTNPARFKREDIIKGEFVIPRIGVTEENSRELLFSLNRAFFKKLELSPPSVSDLVYELYNFESAEELNVMYNACFEVPVSSRYFKWKYLENPAGIGLGFVAKKDNEMIGFYGLIPEWYNAGGKRTQIYQAVDIMTSPKYRRMGVFANLVDYSKKYLQKSNLPQQIISFPGVASRKGLVEKHHWKTMIKFKYAFLNKILFQFSSAPSSNSVCQITEITGFGEEFENYFKERDNSNLHITKYLDRSIVNWRLAEHPEIKYYTIKISKDGELLGFVSCRLEEKQKVFIVIIDFKTSDLYGLYFPEICRFLFNNLENVSVIYSYRPTNKYIRAAFKQMGFIINPMSSGPFSYRSEFVTSQDQITSGSEWLNPDNFDIQPISRDY